MAVLVATTSDALVARSTSIPLGRGTATLSWNGATGITPTLNSIKGTAGHYHMTATGQAPKISPRDGTGSAPPSQYPIADVKGTIGGTGFTLDIVLTLPSSPAPNTQQTFGHVTGTFPAQHVAATLTANVNSRTYAFAGTIGSLRITGQVSQPVQHGHMETAHATFDVTR